MASHYTWGSVTILHDFGGALGWPSDNFFWALIISRSQLLAHAWSGPKYHEQYSTAIAHNKNNNIRLLILLLYIDTHQRVGSSYFPVKIKLTPQETHPHIQLFLCQSPKSVPTRPGMGHATPKLGHPGFLGGGTGISWAPPMFVRHNLEMARV